jgi:hypothetical protein
MSKGTRISEQIDKTIQQQQNKVNQKDEVQRAAKIVQMKTTKNDWLYSHQQENRKKKKLCVPFGGC